MGRVPVKPFEQNLTSSGITKRSLSVVLLKPPTSVFKSDLENNFIVSFHLHSENKCKIVFYRSMKYCFQLQLRNFGKEALVFSYLFVNIQTRK